MTSIHERALRFAQELGYMLQTKRENFEHQLLMLLPKPIPKEEAEISVNDTADQNEGSDHGDT